MTDDATLRDQAVRELELTTVGYRNTHWTVPPPGTHWANALGLLAQIGAAPQPPATTAGGVGISQLGGTLAGMSHLTDGTYQLVIGDQADAALLKTLSPLGFAYFNSVDWNGNPQGLLAAIRATGCPAFLDNVDANAPGMLAFIQQLGLRSLGIPAIANAFDYVGGDPNSDNGVRWCAWAAQLAPYVTHTMCEYFQQLAGGPNITELRTDASYWAGWQKCVAAVRPAHFVGITYGPTANAIYGRASMLLAPGAAAGDVFLGHAWPGQQDPYDPAWTLAAPTNVTMDSAAGTATL